MTLAGKVALVTGGGRAIGKAIALRLARDGANLAIASPDAPELDATAAELRALGRHAVAIVADISEEQQVVRMVEAARTALGKIDILVNNAGITGPTAPIQRVERHDWDQVLAVNLTGVYLCIKHVIPEMIARRQGKIINLASVAGKIGYALRTPYAASKWAVIGLTLSVAKEVGEHNIQVNAVCPGPVKGERMQKLIEQRAKETGVSVAAMELEYVKDTLLKRMIPPEDVAALVAYLASPAGDCITGATLDVTAGYAL